MEIRRNAQSSGRLFKLDSMEGEESGGFTERTFTEDLSRRYRTAESVLRRRCFDEEYLLCIRQNEYRIDRENDGCSVKKTLMSTSDVPGALLETTAIGQHL